MTKVSRKITSTSDSMKLKLALLNIPWGTDQKWGKLVAVVPIAARSEMAPPADWVANVVHAMAQLPEKAAYFQTYGSDYLVSIDELDVGDRAGPSDGDAVGWCGIGRLVFPQQFWKYGSFDRIGRSELLRKEGVNPESVGELRDSYDVADDNTDTPAEEMFKIFETLRTGMSVLIYSENERLPGFIPAMMAMLADPQVHVAKVIYPIVNGRGYELTPDQAGYLAGFADARHLQLPLQDDCSVG